MPLFGLITSHVTYFGFVTQCNLIAFGHPPFIATNKLAVFISVESFQVATENDQLICKIVHSSSTAIQMVDCPQKIVDYY